MITRNIFLKILGIISLMWSCGYSDVRFTFPEDYKLVTPGESVEFKVRVDNLGEDNIFFTGSTIAPSGDWQNIDVLNEDQFYSSVPFPLMQGSSWEGNIFTVSVQGSAVPGTYSGWYYLFGGNDEDADNLLVSRSFSITVQPKPILSNFDWDYDVDIYDLFVLAGYWMRNECTSKNFFCNGADVTHDLKVDLKDFAVLASEWLNEVTPEFDPEVREGFESGNFTALPWSLSGNANWTVASSGDYEGTYTAKSGAIMHNQSSTLEVTIYRNDYSAISFARKVSSESNYDYLRFYIDGVEKIKWSGVQDWAVQTFVFTPGEHTFKWSYTKDGIINNGSDCGWIDDIRVYQQQLCGNGVCNSGEEGWCPDCPSPVCGDGVCDPGETATGCPDCTLLTCGNGVCDMGEEGTGCADCPTVCGDGICERSRGEAWPACVDCSPPVCGDGICDAGEAGQCPDCLTVCGDGICEPTEEGTGCSDCPPVCGNGICEQGETWPCPDCPRPPVCGNEICEAGEAWPACSDCPPPICGNGICEPEEEGWCPDCLTGCDNGICEPGEEGWCPDCPL